MYFILYCLSSTILIYYPNDKELLLWATNVLYTLFILYFLLDCGFNYHLYAEESPDLCLQWDFSPDFQIHVHLHYHLTLQVQNAPKTSKYM